MTLIPMKYDLQKRYVENKWSSVIADTNDSFSTV
jgi:hypothetical protein